jgi:hypothetical protein
MSYICKEGEVITLFERLPIEGQDREERNRKKCIFFVLFYLFIYFGGTGA